MTATEQRNAAGLLDLAAC